MCQKQCSFSRLAGVQDSRGYHIQVSCRKCDALALFLFKDKENIEFEDYFDKTKFSCPGEEYLQSLEKTKNAKELAKIQIRKGSEVKTINGIVGDIIKYSSNKEILVRGESSLICKEDIAEVIKY